MYINRPVYNKSMEIKRIKILIKKTITINKVNDKCFWTLYFFKKTPKFKFYYIFIMPYFGILLFGSPNSYSEINIYYVIGA